MKQEGTVLSEQLNDNELYKKLLELVTDKKEREIIETNIKSLLKQFEENILRPLEKLNHK